MKSLVPISGYTFNAGARTITFIAPYDVIPLANIRLITHLPTNTIIYQFNKNIKGGTKAGAVLTLTFDTTPYANIDELAIDYNWDGIPIPVSGIVGGDASAANQTVEIARLTSILAQLDLPISTRASQATLATRASEVTVAAILAKIIAAPATEATLATRATEATAAAILAKLIVAPSTEAKQDAIIAILATLSTDANLTAGVNAILASLANIDAGIPAALGQTTMANSMPVVIASNQSAIPVTVSGGGDATAANQVTEITRLTSILGQLDVALSTRASEVTMAAALAALNSIDGNIPAGLTVTASRLQVELPPGGTGLTDTELRATPVPVSGPLTDTELRASAVPVSAAALPLPAGAATAALQTQPGVDIGDVTVNNAAGAAAVNIQDGGNSITVDGPLTDAQLRATPVPVSGTVTVTGAGDATAANQATEIASLASIDAGIPAALGQGTMATSMKVVIASDQSAVPVSGPLTDVQLRATPVPVSGTVAVTGAGDATAANQTTEITRLTSILGQLDVALSTRLSESDFDTKIGSLTETAPLTDIASSGLNGRLQRIAQRITSLIALLPASLGQKAKAAALAVTLASDEDLLAYLGIVTETAPVTDTASSGLNGRLQRIAQRLTTLLAVFPTTLAVNSGNKDSSTLRVVLATDQPALTNKLLVTPDSVALPANQSVNISQINAVTPLMGAGNTGTGSLRVTLATDQANLTTPLNTNTKPATTGGLTTYHLVSAATTNATNVKASAGQLYGWFIYNSNAAARKLTFHNTAGSPTAGASVFFSIVIPPSSGANVFSDIGIAFSTGIAITTTTGLADTDSAAVAANDLIINLFYN